MSLFGSILGAVAKPLVGGLVSNFFGKKAAKKQRAIAMHDEFTKFARLRDSAEEGGFNPLTALQSTGGAGFGALPSGQAAPLASQAMLTGMIKGVDDVLNREKETRMTEQQVANDLTKISNEQKRAGGAGKVAAASAPGTIKPRKTPVMKTRMGAAAPLADEVEPGLGPLVVTNPYPKIPGWDVRLTPDPRRVDAEHWEQRGGDIMQEVGGISNIANDVSYSARITAVQNQYGKPVADDLMRLLMGNPEMEFSDAKDQALAANNKERRQEPFLTIDLSNFGKSPKRPKARPYQKPTIADVANGYRKAQ